ncbi:MAG: hypothetical protein ABIG63_17685 [Chloroflexota bacterium]
MEIEETGVRAGVSDGSGSTTSSVGSGDEAGTEVVRLSNNAKLDFGFNEWLRA